MSKTAKQENEVQEIIEENISGILCPSCRFPMRVYRTKKLTGEIARERICDRCGEKIDTQESKLD